MSTSSIRQKIDPREVLARDTLIQLRKEIAINKRSDTDLKSRWLESQQQLYSNASPSGIPLPQQEPFQIESNPVDIGADAEADYNIVFQKLRKYCKDDDTASDVMSSFESGEIALLRDSIDNIVSKFRHEHGSKPADKNYFAGYIHRTLREYGRRMTDPGIVKQNKEDALTRMAQQRALREQTTNENKQELDAIAQAHAAAEAQHIADQELAHAQNLQQSDAAVALALAAEAARVQNQLDLHRINAQAAANGVITRRQLAEQKEQAKEQAKIDAEAVYQQRINDHGDEAQSRIAGLAQGYKVRKDIKKHKAELHIEQELQKEELKKQQLEKHKIRQSDAQQELAFIAQQHIKQQQQEQHAKNLADAEILKTKMNKSYSTTKQQQQQQLSQDTQEWYYDNPDAIELYNTKNPNNEWHWGTSKNDSTERVRSKNSGVVGIARLITQKEEYEKLHPSTTGKGLKKKKIYGRGATDKNITKYKQINKFLVDMQRLNNDNILCVRYASTNSLHPILKTVRVSNSVKTIILGMMNNHFIESEYKKLNEQDKRQVNKFVKYCHLDFPIEDSSQEEQLKYDVLLGEWNSGNDSIEIKKELKKYICYAMSDNRLPRYQAMNLLYELSL